MQNNQNRVHLVDDDQHDHGNHHSHSEEGEGDWVDLPESLIDEIESLIGHGEYEEALELMIEEGIVNEDALDG